MATQLEVEVHLALPEQGGLPTSVTGGEWRTVLTVAGEHWSARLYFAGELVPGETARVTAQMLFPEAEVHFRKGTEFTVWQGRVVGSGRVLSVAA